VENKEMNMIVKIMGIVGAAFCGISLIIPWAGLGPLGYYTWGGTSIQGQWDIFYITTMSSGVTEAIVSAVCMIIAFILTIIALIIGILGAKNLGVKKSNSFLIAGILSIVAIVLCVVSVSQVNATLGQLAGILGIGIGYSWGFFLMIFAVVMFFVAFGLQKVFVSAPTPAMTQPMYQQPMQTQAPAQYYAQQPQTPPPPPAQTTPPPQPQAPPSPPPVQPTTPQVQTGTKFCPDCGAKLEGKPKFCNKCGNKLA